MYLGSWNLKKIHQEFFFTNTVAMFLKELLLETKGSFSTKLKDVLDRKFVKRTIIIDHVGGIY